MGYLKPVRSFLVDDFAAIPFTDEEKEYCVGTMAFMSDPEGLPELARNPDTGKPGFTAHRALLYATQDCYVRFNGPKRVQHLVLAGILYEFHLRIHTIYVVRQTTDGILYAHFEG
ncbi:MAG: hypothetical protein JRD89_15210 [Deltaproteobacteria bacterium]|nr:hypothetical protein [Deltaproteobacteria bacterium]